MIKIIFSLLKDEEFFASCVKGIGWEDKLQLALKTLADAGEPTFAEKYDQYLYSDG